MSDGPEHKFDDDQIDKIIKALYNSSIGMTEASLNVARAAKEASAEQVQHQSQVTDRIVGRFNALIKSMDAATEAQTRHQSAVFWLTLVIAAATVVYTVMTGVQVYYRIG